MAGRGVGVAGLGVGVAGLGVGVAVGVEPGGGVGVTPGVGAGEPVGWAPPVVIVMLSAKTSNAWPAVSFPSWTVAMGAVPSVAVDVEYTFVPSSHASTMPAPALPVTARSSRSCQTPREIV